MTFLSLTVFLLKSIFTLKLGETAGTGSDSWLITLLFTIGAGAEDGLTNL